MSIIPELPSPFNKIIIENEVGTYKDFQLKPDDTYPLAGVTYPTDYGFIPGYIGEDGYDLDVFVGTDLQGRAGYFTVWRGDVPEEHKYYVAMKDEELSEVLRVFAPVTLGNVAIKSFDELITDIQKFKTQD
ncbi:MAG: hypothetical protein WAQ25_00815 [Candidatus Saccharimonas sp.]